MSRLFDYQNPVWRFMGRVADVFLLTVLWILCCIPIITAGASTAALYYVTLKMVKNQDGYLGRTFWHAFMENLKTATGVWCIMLAIGMLLGSGYYLIFWMRGRLSPALLWSLLVFGVIYLLVLTLVFPLTARLEAGVGRLLGMTFMTAVKNFSWVLLMAVTALCVLAIGIFVFWPFLLFGAGAAAYLNSFILVHVIFPKYAWNN